MNIGAASAANLYTFQNTASTRGQSAAVLQALTQVYADNSSAAGSDPLSNLLTASNMAPVVNAISSLTNGDAASSGNAEAIPTEALQAYLSYGGLNTASAATLFSNSFDSTGSSPLQGFDSALTANSALAMAAYSASLSFATGAANPTQAEQAVQAARTTSTAAIMNLLG